MEAISSIDKIPFGFVQCSSKYVEDVEAGIKTVQEGAIYFVLDTKQIFLGKNNSLLPMGKSSGVVFAQKDTDLNNLDSNVSFNLADLEEAYQTTYPQPNDLIFNKDGCFYRVSSVNEAEDSLTATKLTVSGSGGGGGGPSGQAKPQVSDLEKNSSYISVDDVDKTIISFTGKSVTTENNYIDLIEIYFGKTSAPTITLNQIFQFNEKIENQYASKEEFDE